MGIAKRLLETLAATADIERFGEWKGKLEDALEELDGKRSKNEVGRAEYEKQKKDLQGKLDKATDLLKQSQERLESAKDKKRSLL